MTNYDNKIPLPSYLSSMIPESPPMSSPSSIPNINDDHSGDSSSSTAEVYHYCEQLPPYLLSPPPANNAPSLKLIHKIFTTDNNYELRSESVSIAFSELSDVSDESHSPAISLLSQGTVPMRREIYRRPSQGFINALSDIQESSSMHNSEIEEKKDNDDEDSMSSISDMNNMLVLENGNVDKYSRSSIILNV